MGLLNGLLLFDDLSSAEISELELFCQQRLLRAGTILFSEGDDASAMYIVRKGKLKVFKKSSDGEKILGYVGQDEFVGEMAFFDGDDIPKTRMASVSAIEDSELIVIMNQSIVDLAKKHKDIFDKIASTINSRKSLNKNVL